MVPEFVLDGFGIVGGHRVEQFQPFGLDLLFDVLVFGPREAHAVGLGVDAVGFGQRRQAARQAVIGAFGAFGGCRGLFLALDAVPVLELLGLTAVGGVPEDVGVAAHHFGGFDVERVGEGGAARAGHQLADEDDEEGHVAEFFNHVRGLAGADGVHEFVALLDDVFGQGFGRLRAVPRAAVGSDEAVDDFVEAIERGLRGGVGIGGGNGLRGAGIGHLGSLWVHCWKNGPTPDIARNMGDFKREGEMGRGRRRNLGRGRGTFLEKGPPSPPQTPPHPLQRRSYGSASGPATRPLRAMAFVPRRCAGKECVRERERERESVCVCVVCTHLFNVEQDVEGPEPQPAVPQSMPTARISRFPFRLPFPQRCRRKSAGQVDYPLFGNM